MGVQEWRVLTQDRKKWRTLLESVECQNQWRSYRRAKRGKAGQCLGVSELGGGLWVLLLFFF